MALNLSRIFHETKNKYLASSDDVQRTRTMIIPDFFTQLSLPIMLCMAKLYISLTPFDILVQF